MLPLNETGTTLLFFGDSLDVPHCPVFLAIYSMWFLVVICFCASETTGLTLKRAALISPSDPQQLAAGPPDEILLSKLLAACFIVE